MGISAQCVQNHTHSPERYMEKITVRDRRARAKGVERGRDSHLLLGLWVLRAQWITQCGLWPRPRCMRAHIVHGGGRTEIPFGPCRVFSFPAFHRTDYDPHHNYTHFQSLFKKATYGNSGASVLWFLAIWGCVCGWINLGVFALPEMFLLPICSDLFSCSNLYN